MDFKYKNIDKITEKVYNNNICRVKHCLITRSINNPTYNDFFNHDLSKIFKSNQIISESENISFLNEEESQLEYFDKLEIFNSNCIRHSFVFDDLKIEESQRVFLFCFVHSDINRKAIIRTGRSNKFKLWLNNILIHNQNIASRSGVHQYTGFSDTCFLSVFLKEGINLLIIEINKETEMLSLRISDYYKEFSGNNGKLVNDFYSYFCSRKISVVSKSCICSNINDYKFMLIPYDFTELDQNETLVVRIGQEIVKTHYYEEICVNIQKYIKQRKRILDFNIVYKDNNGKIYSEVFKILIANLYNEKIEYSNLIAKLNVDRLSNNIVDINLIGYLNHLEKKYHPVLEGIIPSELEMCFRNLDNLMQIKEHDLDFNRWLKSAGVKRFFYRSELDNEIQCMAISVPENYSESRLYPVVINIFAEVQLSFVSFHNNVKKREAILVEISTRGVTQGSYIGETAILEAINVIKSNFNVDLDRIHFIGYSTGAFSVWAMLQNYPNRFSGSTIISGFPYMPNIKNLISQKLINISANNDDMKHRAFIEPDSILKEINPNYMGIMLDDGDHFTIITALLSESLIDWMFP